MGEILLAHQQEVMKSIKEWMEEFPLEYRKERRKEYLLGQIDIVRERFFAECKFLAENTDGLTYWAEKLAEKLDRELQRLNMEVKILTGKETGMISPETIAHARTYPIDKITKVVRGVALCPFHNDKHPSMDVRKNFYYCYTCGAHGDAIDLYIKLNNATFAQAIKALT